MSVLSALHLPLQATLLSSMAVVLGAALVGGRLARRVGQPPVVGEMLAALSLGPVLLGAVAPGVEAALFPPEVRAVFGGLAQLGVGVFMFIVGLELRTGGARGAQVAGVTLGSLALPMGLGMLTALLLPALPPAGLDAAPPHWAQVLFLGGALSVTAVPVLALLLRDRGMMGTPVAITALAAAAASDAFVWMLLAVIGGVVAMPGTSLGLRLSAAAALLGVALFLRAALTRLSRRAASPSPVPLIALALVGITLSAAASDVAGLHTVIGPVLLGLAVPRASALGPLLEDGLEPVARAALLPFFFLTAGFALDLTALAAPGTTLAWLGVAVLGKVGGTLLGARLTRTPWPQAWQLGVLMNTRGLTELVYLTAGLQLNLISPALYTSLVIVTVVTTLATAPSLDMLQGRHSSRLGLTP